MDNLNFINKAQFNQLREIDPSGQLECELLKIFIKDTRDDLSKLLADPRFYSHRIKGRAGQLGFVNFQNIACQLQSACDSNQNNGIIEELVNRVMIEGEMALKFVQDYCTIKKC